MVVVSFKSLGVVLVICRANAFLPQAHPLLKASPQTGSRQQLHTAAVSTCQPMQMSVDDASESRHGFLKNSAVGIVAGAVAVTTSTGASSPAAAAQVNAWEQIELPVASVLYDIAFDPKHPDHGLVVGAQGTFLEVSLMNLYRIYTPWKALGCSISLCYVFVLTRSVCTVGRTLPSR